MAKSKSKSKSKSKRGRKHKKLTYSKFLRKRPNAPQSLKMALFNLDGPSKIRIPKRFNPNLFELDKSIIRAGAKRQRKKMKAGDKLMKKHMRLLLRNTFRNAIMPQAPNWLNQREFMTLNMFNPAPQQPAFVTPAPTMAAPPPPPPSKSKAKPKKSKKAPSFTSSAPSEQDPSTINPYTTPPVFTPPSVSIPTIGKSTKVKKTKARHFNPGFSSMKMKKLSAFSKKQKSKKTPVMTQEELDPDQYNIPQQEVESEEEEVFEDPPISAPLPPPAFQSESPYMREEKGIESIYETTPASLVGYGPEPNITQKAGGTGFGQGLFGLDLNPMGITHHWNPSEQKWVNDQ